jgi:hypothetical protein
VVFITHLASEAAMVYLIAGSVAYERNMVEDDIGRCDSSKAERDNGDLHGA